MTDTDLRPDRSGGDPYEGFEYVTGEVPLLTRLNARGFRIVQVADAVVLTVVMVGTMYVRYRWQWPTYPMSLYWVSFAVTLGIFMSSLYFGGMYEREPRLGYPPALPRAMRITLGSGGLVALLNFAATGLARDLGFTTARALPMPILNLAVLIVVGAMGVAGNRRIVKVNRLRREGPPRVLLVGATDQLRTARTHIATDPSHAEVVAEASGVSELLQTVADRRVSDVVLLSSDWLDELYPDILHALEAQRVSVLQRVTAKETMFGLERVRQVGGMPFVPLRTQTMPVSRERFKRFTDLAMLSLLLPVLLPLTVLVALYELVVVGPPLLYWQVRVGAEGRLFRLAKFRTMVPDAEAVTGATLAREDDRRIIPACRWLRATRLDELPQIWNILRGDMSLVGPRPERPELTVEFERIIPGYSRRHEIPPGLTGLAQIHGRYHTDPEYKLGYDLQYLVNWSPVLDMEILLRTVWVVVTRRI